MSALSCHRILSALRTVLLPAAMAALGALPAIAAGAAASMPSDHRLQQAYVPLGAGSQVPPKYLYLFSPSARWKGALHWRYNPANAPAFASDRTAVVARIASAFDKWSSQCGISYVYDGETDVAPDSTQPDGVSVIGWGTIDPGLGAWTYAWYRIEGSDRVIFDADITLNPGNVASLADLDRLMTHEWGHAMGLDHSDVESVLMSGPPSTHYNALVTPQADDLRGCRCQYGLPSGASAGYACALPPKIDFGSAAVGQVSARQAVTMKNSGNAPLSIQASTVADPQFRHAAGCMPGTVVMPGQSCTIEVEVTPKAVGPVTSQLGLYTSDGDYQFALASNGVTETAPAAGARTVEVVEYYNASLDHYFLTWIAAEMANLDAGATPTRWTRTGRTFHAFADPQPKTSQVCRFYIPPTLGNSHFFGRSAAECTASQHALPGLVLEDPDYMHVLLPSAGTCPGGTQPVYRLFNNRPDANHRYTIDRAVRDQMVAQGWVAEGDGPDAVAMCVPM
ncbi:MAG: choice-of-anchor D domain-containing protein [Burkholderiales bacterium]